MTDKKNKNTSIQGNKVLSFPSTHTLNWKAQFEYIHDQGKGYLLSFPFTSIKEKQAMLDLYEAVPKLLKDYPAVVDKFFQDADIAVKTAKEAIEEDRLKNMPGDPAQLLLFNKKFGGNQ